MIHEIGKELQTALAATGCPFKVYDRESFKTTTWANQRIVIERDGKDSFAEPASQTINPKIYYVRTVACKITIYAQSTKAGALPFEHERLAEKALDSVLCALNSVAQGANGNGRANVFKPTGGGFVKPDDLTAAETPSGAVYELTFTFDRGVSVHTWAGAKRPESTLASGFMRSRTSVSQNGSTTDDVGETACGA